MKQQLSFDEPKFHWAKIELQKTKLLTTITSLSYVTFTFANTLGAPSCFVKSFVVLKKVSNCLNLTCKYILRLLLSWYSYSGWLRLEILYFSATFYNIIIVRNHWRFTIWAQISFSGMILGVKQHFFSLTVTLNEVKTSSEGKMR